MDFSSFNVMDIIEWTEPIFTNELDFSFIDVMDVMDAMEWTEPSLNNDCIDELIDSKCKSDVISLQSLMLSEVADMTSVSCRAVSEFSVI